MATQSIPMDWTAYHNSLKAQNPSASQATRATAQTALGGAPQAPSPYGDGNTSAYMASVMAGNAPQDPMMAQYTAQQFSQGRPLGNNNYAPVTPPAGWSSTGQYTAPATSAPMAQSPTGPPVPPPTYSGSPNYFTPASAGSPSTFSASPNTSRAPGSLAQTRGQDPYPQAPTPPITTQPIRPSPSGSGASMQSASTNGRSAGDNTAAPPSDAYTKWLNLQKQMQSTGQPGQPGGIPQAAGPYQAQTQFPPASGGGTGSTGPYSTGSVPQLIAAQQAYQSAQDAYNNETDPTKKAALQTQLTSAKTAYQSSLSGYNQQAQGQQPGGGVPGTGGTPGTGGNAPPSWMSPTGGGSASGYPSISGGYTNPAISPPGTGGDSNLAQSLESDREMTLAGGQQLQNQFRQDAGTAAGQSNFFQGQLANAYAPLLAGQGGYTQAQIDAINAQGGQFGLNQLNPNAYTQNLQGGAANINAALGGESGAVNQALGQGQTAVQQAINPAELKWTPEMSQALKNAAAQASAAQTQATVQDIQNRAFAAGNVSPAAIAAMQDRARLTGQINAAGAMTQAQVQANQSQLGASQTYANLAAQNAQETAQRNTGAQLQVGAQNVGAQQYLAGAGQGAVGAQENELMNANQLESGRATTTANANLQAGQEARNNYLGTQSQQANQNRQVAGQQQLGAYNSATGGTNQAAQIQVGNKAVNQANPGSIPNLIFAHGGVVKGPQKALVGERGLEAIVPLGPPKIAPQPHLMHMPRFQTARNPNYGIAPASLGRTMTRSGFQRILPQFEDGGTIDPMYSPGQDGAMPMGTGDVIDPSYAGTSPDPNILNPGWSSDTEPGLTDQTTGYGPGKWQRTAALTAALVAGRRFPGLAGQLAGYGMGDQPWDSRQMGGAAAGDIAGRKNPVAGQLAQDAITKQPPAADNAVGKSTAAAGQSLVSSILHNPEPPKPGGLIMSGGSAPSKPSIPLPRPGSAKQPQPKQPAPKAPVQRPLDGGQTHDAPVRSPNIHLGPIAGSDPTTLPTEATQPHTPNMHFGPLPGGGDGGGGFSGSGGVVPYDPFPGQTGPESPMPGTLDPNQPTGSNQIIDYGGGYVDPTTGGSVDPTVGSPISESPAPDPGWLNPIGGDSYPPVQSLNPGDVNGPHPELGRITNTEASLPLPIPPDNTMIAQPGSVSNPTAPFPTDPMLPAYDPMPIGFTGGGTGPNPPEGSGTQPPVYGDTGNFGGGNWAPNPPEDNFDGYARGGVFGTGPSRARHAPQGVRHKVSTGRPKKGDMSPASAKKSAPYLSPMPEMAPASPVSTMPPVEQDLQGYGDGGIFSSKSFPGYADGGIVSPEEERLLHSPYGPSELIDHPQIRTLGKYQAEAIIPLNRRKTNHLNPEDVPRLIQQYGSR